MIIWHDRNPQVKKRTVKVGFVLLSYGKLYFHSAAEIFSTHANISVSYAGPPEHEQEDDKKKDDDSNNSSESESDYASNPSGNCSTHFCIDNTDVL